MTTNYRCSSDGGARPGLAAVAGRLELHVSLDYASGCWVVSFERDCGPDAETVRLFGTHKVPTPYTLRTPVAVVLENLRRLNPDAIVVQS